MATDISAELDHREWTVADLLARFGPIPVRRVRQNPVPGSAAELDLLEIHDRDHKLCELVDGVLVEKEGGFFESVIAMRLGALLLAFVDRHRLGIVAGEAGMLRLLPGLVRIPDLSFISWDRLPNREIPTEPILAMAADLAVEILSRGNTKEEIDQKIREYFATGTRLVWIIDPRRKTVRVLTAPDGQTIVDETGTLDGGTVLPGLQIEVRAIFNANGPA